MTAEHYEVECADGRVVPPPIPSLSAARSLALEVWQGCGPHRVIRVATLDDGVTVCRTDVTDEAES